MLFLESGESAEVGDVRHIRAAYSLISAELDKGSPNFYYFWMITSIGKAASEAS
ncbi:hypothetical protein AKA01nite_07280 [Alkalibacterium kapii]|uniref:Uncharacterized protein n=1 Tax=Alkalibacterium kapii TaxID=426704 RepID=A0A511ASM9_9LACT|nr:hypothetical protein AKA01nite_07280 [Alkalibacterium kapii]